VSDLPAVEAVVNGAGPIHLLVNNAGVSQLQSVLDTTPDAYDRVMSVNLKAPVFLSQYVARGMVERGDGGAIVNVSSVASSVALTDHLAYCTSKAGMDMATKVMALELGRHKIRVNAVNPTVVMTDMGKRAWSDPVKSTHAMTQIPLGRFAEEADVVNAIVFLLSDKSSMLSGVTLPVDGGRLVH
jgi:L-xylulose reductase